MAAEEDLTFEELCARYEEMDQAEYAQFMKEDESTES